MRWAAAALLILACLVAPATAAAEPTGRLLVSLSGPRTEAAQAASARAVIASAGARSTGRNVPQVGMMTVAPRPGERLGDLAARLRDDPRVRAVDRDRRAAPRMVPNDPTFVTPDPAAEAAGATLQWWAERSRFPQAWDLADGDSATVAIIDSGVDGTHPEILGKVRRSVDLDPVRSHRGPGVDESGHGTHVASLACANPDNGIGLAGAGYECGLMIAKSDLTDSSVIRALVDATDNGADVISMSIGTDGRSSPPQGMVDALNYAYEHGVVLVAAAANQHTREQGDPANVVQPTGTGPDITAGTGLTVTAADFTGQRARFAGYGSQISMAAYGAFSRFEKSNGLLGAFPPPVTGLERGTASRPPCRCRAELAGDSRFAFLEGASMATPIVAGAAALMIDRNPELHPDDVIRILKRTAQRDGGWNRDLGWGILDAYAAVAAVAELDRHPPTSSVVAPSSVDGDEIRLRIAARDDPAHDIAATGVRRVRIYRALENRRPRRVAATRGGSVVVPVEPGRSYSFFTRAVDRAGNVEAEPRRPDVRTVVTPER